MKTILLLAGEASGDHHAAELARVLKTRVRDVRLVGTGGPRMRAEGVELLAGLDDLAVMGFAEVVGRLPFFRRLERRIGGLIRGGALDLLIAIDYPGFNMRAAATAHAAGLPVLYYIAPQVWAWKPARARKLARIADRIAVILPFEEEIFLAAGADVSFVGHPLLDRAETVAGRGEFCARWGLDAERPIVGLLPGSRAQEIRRHLDVFSDAAHLVVAARPDVQPVLGRAATLGRGLLDVPGLPAVDDTRALLRHARAALVKSGTSTLETALEGTPFVVAYRTSPVTFAIARRVVRVGHVALANLVAGERVVPELLQGEATPRALADHLLTLLDPDDPASERQRVGLARVRERLGTPGASVRVADMAVELLASRP